MWASTTSKLMQTNNNDLIDVWDRVTISRWTHPNVTQREIVLVESKTVAWIIVTRAYEACRLSDTASLESQTPFEWQPGDYFSVNNTAWTIQEMQDDIDSRLLNWTLRTWLVWTNKIITSNNSWVETWVNYWTSGQALIFTWPNSEPTAQDIPEQLIKDKTAITDVDSSEDYLILSDWSDTWKNKKILIDDFNKKWTVTWNWASVFYNTASVWIDSQVWNISKNDSKAAEITLWRTIWEWWTINANMNWYFFRASNYAADGTFRFRIKKNNTTYATSTNYSVNNQTSVSWSVSASNIPVVPWDTITFHIDVNINSSQPSWINIVTASSMGISYHKVYENLTNYDNSGNTFNI